jgi:hypothetical protein
LHPHGERPRAWLNRLGSEFDRFLFAPIAQGSDGSTLTVVSALARSDVDPWQAAAELAHLPNEAAVRKLSTLIAALPEESSAPREAALRAARLIALLPRHEPVTTAAHQASGDSPSANHSRMLTSMIIYALFVLGLLGAQWLLESRQSLAAAKQHPAPTNSQTAPR